MAFSQTQKVCLSPFSHFRKRGEREDDPSFYMFYSTTSISLAGLERSSRAIAIPFYSFYTERAENSRTGDDTLSMVRPSQVRNATFRLRYRKFPFAFYLPLRSCLMIRTCDSQMQPRGAEKLEKYSYWQCCLTRRRQRVNVWTRPAADPSDTMYNSSEMLRILLFFFIFLSVYFLC